MQFFINEASLHGQFMEQKQALSALKRFRSLYQLVEANSLTLFRSGDLKQRPVTEKMMLKDFIASAPHADKFLHLKWIHCLKPCWKLEPASAGAYVAWDCDGEHVVSEGESIFEASVRKTKEEQVSLLSFSPSDYARTSVTTYVIEEESTEVSLENYYDDDHLEAYFQAFAFNVNSWPEFEDCCRSHFKSLDFSKQAFKACNKFPFRYKTVEKLRNLFACLDKVVSGRISGALDQQAEQLFKIDSNFSDASETEKGLKKKPMHFKSPISELREAYYYHGKFELTEKEDGRFHFQWPQTDKTPLYIPYVGPKLTKQ